jgi:hypothetical protein
MIDLGLTDFDLRIEQSYNGFKYYLMFRLLASLKFYAVTGIEPTPQQCADAAMSYVARVVREAVKE